MTIQIDPQILALLAFTWTVVTAMASLVYRELRTQIGDKDKRIASLELAAAEAMRAKDAEIAEYKRRVFGNQP